MGIRFQRIAQIKCPATPTAMSVGEDDRTIVAACGEELIGIDLDTNSHRVVCNLAAVASELSLIVGRRLAAISTGAQAVDLIDLRTGKRIPGLRREGAPDFVRSVPVNHIALEPGGERLVTTTHGSRIFVSNTETGDWEDVMFVKYDGCDVTASPNGKHVALFGAPKASELSGHVTLYLIRKGLQPLWTRWHDSQQAVTHAQFNADGRFLVSCGAGDGVRIWDVPSGDPRWHLTTNEQLPIRKAWCQNDPRFLTTLGADLAIYQQGKEDPIFHQSLEPFSLSSVSPSGRRLLLAGADGTLSVWNLHHSP